MTSIFSGLSTAERALYAQQFGMEITQRNIANAGTAGYTRQRTVFIEPTLGLSNGTLGNGAPSVSVESFRHRFIDYRIVEELQVQGEKEGTSAALQQIEALFNENQGQGLQTSLTNFFGSLSSLANSPEDPTLRQQVLSRANELAQEFQQLSSQIAKVRTTIDRAVGDDVDEINNLTSQLAALNSRIPAARAEANGDESSLLDSRQNLLDELSKLVDVSYYETESGSITITTRQGALLVIGDQSNALSTVASGPDNLLHITLDGKDITSNIVSGQLGGLLKARDTTIAGYAGQLDDLAAGLINAVNAQHTLGSDFNGNPGVNFFVPFTPGSGGTNAGAAGAIAVAITDPKLIAAAGAGSGVGSNSNANLLAAIANAKIMNGGSSTLGQHYSNLISTIGSDLRASDEDLKTQENLLLQLQNQRDSVSGVNLDEEAINIIRFQKAYEASARMVQVWDSLAETIMQMMGV